MVRVADGSFFSRAGAVSPSVAGAVGASEADLGGRGFLALVFGLRGREYLVVIRDVG